MFSGAYYAAASDSLRFVTDLFHREDADIRPYMNQKVTARPAYVKMAIATI